MIRLGSILVLAACAVSACSGSPSGKVQTKTFDETFELVRRVVLEEPDTAPLTGIENFAPTPNGFLVVDRGRPQVRVFDADGNLTRIVGRHGEGPGEFRGPTDAIVDSAGRLFVAEARNATVTRFHSGSFTYDTTFKLPGMVTYDLDWLNDHLLTVHWNELAPPNNHYVSVVSTNGDVLAKLHPVDSLVWEVPYWASFAGPVAASGRTHAVTGNNFIYPLHLYDSMGSHIREFGAAPPSWQPLARPELGAFVGAGSAERLRAWLTAALMVSRVGVYRDSAIIVVHARPDPQVTNFSARKDTLLDIYSLTGTKELEDVPVPHRVLRVESFLYLLEGSPPDPWTVGIYRRR